MHRKRECRVQDDHLSSDLLGRNVSAFVILFLVDNMEVDFDYSVRGEPINFHYQTADVAKVA